MQRESFFLARTRVTRSEPVTKRALEREPHVVRELGERTKKLRRAELVERACRDFRPPYSPAAERTRARSTREPSASRTCSIASWIVRKRSRARVAGAPPRTKPSRIGCFSCRLLLRADDGVTIVFERCAASGEVRARQGRKAAPFERRSRKSENPPIAPLAGPFRVRSKAGRALGRAKPSPLVGVPGSPITRRSRRRSGPFGRGVVGWSRSRPPSDAGRSS
jgi:hypothetical protein